MSELKLCTRCNKEKPRDVFSNDSKRVDGKYQYCKECVREEQRERSLTPIGVYTTIKGRVNYNKKHIPTQYKPLTISKEDFIKWYEDEPKVCVYCGIKAEDVHIMKELFGTSGRRLSVDCINNHLGYSFGNLALACHLCNETKRNLFSFDEMRKIGQKYIRPKWEAELNEQY